MLLPDHPLFDLQSLAAIAHGAATLHVHHDDPDAVEHLLTQHVGAVPQAEALEHANGTVLAIRCELMGRPLTAWQPLMSALGASGWDWGLMPGVHRCWQHAIDEGRLRGDALGSSHGLHAVRWTDVERDQPAGFDVVSKPLTDLEPEHPTAIAALELQRVSDASLVEVILHRTDGRMGFRLFFEQPLHSGHGNAVLERIGACIEARASHPEVRLATDMRWDDLPVPYLLVWMVGPPGPTWPGSLLRSDAAPVTSACMRHVGWATSHDHHPPKALALESQWLNTPTPQFCATWHLEGSPPDHGWPFPSLPDLFEEVAHRVEIIPMMGRRRTFVRVRDVLAEMDLVLPHTHLTEAPLGATGAESIEVSGGLAGARRQSGPLQSLPDIERAMAALATDNHEQLVWLALGGSHAVGISLLGSA